MGQDNLTSSLDRAIERLERKAKEISVALDKLKTARSAIKEVFDGMPVELLADMELDEQSNGQSEVPQRTHYERIMDFLNQAAGPQTIADIEKGTGIPRTSLTAVLYRTHADQFINCDMPGRAKGWVLKSSQEQSFGGPPEGEIPF